MKKFKKTMAVVIVAVMAMMYVVPMSFAADMETAKENGNFSVTITATDNATGHNYVAYQIFKGDLLEKDGATATNTGANLVLSNIEFGDGVNGTDLISALRTASDTSGNVLEGKFPSTVTDAASLAKAMEEIGDDSAIAQAIADIVAKNLTSTTSGTGSATGVTGLKAGYYFIKDNGTFTGDNAGAYTRYILQVVHSVTITQKSSIPSLDKEVQERDDAESSDDVWGKVADYDKGDAVPFKITGTLPDKFAEFDYFKTYTIEDTLSAGLTPPAASDVKVTLNTIDGTSLATFFDVNVDTTTRKITVSLKDGNDLKTINTPSITKDSKIIVSYSATLNDDAVAGTTGNENSATLTFSNDPNWDGTGGNEPSDVTPPTNVVVFTYDLVVNKVNDAETPAALSGAHFALYKMYDNSKYDATKHGTSVTTVTYDEGRQTYTFPTDGKYVKVEEITTGTTFTFDGLDDGKYVLVETATPAGYNSIAPIPFEVTAVLDATGKTITTINGKSSGEIDLGTQNATVDLSAGSLTTNVVNNSGSELPSTGGIGTTIFYLIGAILVIGAGVLLVTRRRMRTN